MHRDVASNGYPQRMRHCMWHYAVLVAACLVMLSACGRPASVPPTPNPTPKQIYKVTVDVRGAPGEFVSAEGNVQYQISRTWKCMPMVPIQGTPEVAYIHDVKFPLKKVSATRFVGYVVGEDRFVPQDDYGLGACEWEIQGTPRVDLSNGRNRFYAGASGKCCPSKTSGTMIHRMSDWNLSAVEAGAKYGAGSLSFLGYEHVRQQGWLHKITPDKYFLIDISMERTP